MKVNITLEQNDFDVLHDIVFGIFSVKLDNEALTKIWNSLPDHIKGSATQWGVDDSVVRDDIYSYLKSCMNLTPIDSHNEDENER